MAFTEHRGLALQARQVDEPGGHISDGSGETQAQVQASCPGAQGSGGWAAQDSVMT